MDSYNTKDKLQKYPKYFNIMVFTMIFTGIWTSPTNREINMKVFGFYTFMGIFGVLGSILNLFEVDTYDVYAMYETLIHIFLIYIGISGYIYMVSKRVLIDAMFTVIESGFDSFNDDKAKILRKKTDSSNRFLVKTVAYVIVVAHVVKAISTEFYHPSSPTKKPFIPVSLYFYKSDSLSFYYIMYIFQFFASASGATLNVLGVAICVGFVYIISCEVSVLMAAFENADNAHRGELNSGSLSARSQDDLQLYEHLKLLVNHHINLIRLKQEAEVLISLVAFNMFVMSEFVVCFCIFQIYQLWRMSSEPDMAIIMNRVALLAALMVQQFVYFVAGQDLETKSTLLHNFLYYSNWHNRSMKYCSGIRIMFERTKKPFILQAGFLIPINLRSFVTCMQATFSYFNLLRAMLSG